MRGDRSGFRSRCSVSVYVLVVFAIRFLPFNAKVRHWNRRSRPSADARRDAVGRLYSAST